MPPRNFGGYGGRLALTAQRECTPNGGAVAIVPRRLDAAELVPLVRRPRHRAPRRWEPRALDAGSQALATAHRGRVRHHLPLLALVGDAVADLNLHGQDGGGVGVGLLAGWSLGWRLLALPRLPFHSIT